VLYNVCVFITSCCVFFMFCFSLCLFLLFLLIPDISMLGYLYNNKIGSYIYNIGHSYIIPILITLLYLAMGVDLLLGIALIWLAHIAMDRTIGYGLKYTVGFDKTTIQKV